MPHQRLAGFLLLLAGSVCILAPVLPFQEAASGPITLLGFGLFMLGSAFLAIQHNNGRSYGAFGALRLRRVGAGGPAKHLKIRIRCAR